MSKGQELNYARRLAKTGKQDDAWKIVERWMDDDPSDPNAVNIAAYILHDTKQYGLAYQIAKRACELAPEKSESWSNLGRACKELWKIEECEYSFRKAIQLSENREIKGSSLLNLCAILNDAGQFKAAEKVGFEAVSILPNVQKARFNYGLSLLGQNKWEGWDYYVSGLGSNYRLRVPAGQEPDWDGTKGKKLFIYGEQGLGDEISFASMFNGAIDDCSKVVVECDPKLANLFKRSFPNASIYGTRRKARNWNQEDSSPDYSVSFGNLGFFYCRENPSGKPYLKADPVRRLMWRALFDTKKKPVIGISWTGGVRHTGAKFRELSLEQLLPILKSVDAHWVSLQYHDASDEIAEFKKLHSGIDIEQYSFATLTNDYDDTASLVAECDFVVSMQTAVVHLCGALGKECLTLLPTNSQWRYGEEGEKTVWYESVRLYRQKKRGEWTYPIHRIKDELAGRYREAKAA